MQGRHKQRGLLLWQAAGRDLGVPMISAGRNLPPDLDLSKVMRDYGKSQPRNFFNMPVKGYSPINAEAPSVPMMSAGRNLPPDLDILKVMQDYGNSQPRNFFNTPIKDLNIDWFEGLRRSTTIATAVKLLGVSPMKSLLFGAMAGMGSNLIGASPTEKNDSTVVVYFNNTINLTQSSQKQDVIDAILSAVAELQKKLNAVVETTIHVDPRLSFDGGSQYNKLKRRGGENEKML